MFYRVNDMAIQGSTVIVPSISVGNIPQLSVDLLIGTLNPVLVGYISHENLIPVVGPNAFHGQSAPMCAPCEVYYQAAHHMIILQIRGAIVPGSEKEFSHILCEWMLFLQPKRVIILMSVAAEIRQDKDINGCQIRFALPSNLKSQLSDELLNLGWFAYRSPSTCSLDASLIGDDTNGKLNAPSGGYGQHLYEIGIKKGLPLLGIMMFAYEGDNETEALALVNAVNSYLSLEITCWKRPISWALLYGSSPPPGLY
ncbi:proteasome assembly chaperone 2 [Hetaerina americana]|uniref:proteasome assembly chaperone 2 n=1 Tax=Hetaerina americana TaxID=62018 RepID=UPI003A7F5E2B